MHIHIHSRGGGERQTDKIKSAKTFVSSSNTVQQKTEKKNRGNTKCSVKCNMEYKIADLKLKNVNLISGDNDKQDGYFAKNK